MRQESEPVVGLADFFQCNLQRVDEVGSRLRPLCLFVVGAHGSATSQQLIPNASARNCCGQRLGELDNSSRKMQQTLVKILSTTPRWHAD